LSGNKFAGELALSGNKKGVSGFPETPFLNG
jgi:hypothetical protein